MPPKRDRNITAFFAPKNEGKVDTDKVKDEMKSDTVKANDEKNLDGETTRAETTINTNESVADTANAIPPTPSPAQDAKGKGKRPLSTIVSPPEKRQDTKSIPTHLSAKDLPSDWLATLATPSPSNLTLTVHKGDLFASAPPNALLIHACNTQGSWGAGIARAFRDRYPNAYAIYRSFCTKTHDPKSNPIPMGTALLIPPVDVRAGKGHWIGCLFTSAKYGKAKAKPEVIVRNTVPAMQMLLELVRVVGEDMGGEVGEVRMCKINSGLFGVPWEKTSEAVESMGVRAEWRGEVHVWEP